LTEQFEAHRRSGAVRAFAGVLALTLTACSSSITPVLGCTAADGIEPVCEFRNPEDMVAVPPGDWLLISQMAQAGGGPAGPRRSSFETTRMDPGTSISPRTRK
jgi:hypothetical protein